MPFSVMLGGVLFLIKLKINLDEWNIVVYLLHE